MEKVLQQILEKLDELSQGQEAQNQRLERLEKGQEALRSDVTALHNGQEALRSDVTALHNGQEALRSDVTALHNGQEALRSDVTALHNSQADLQAQISRMETRLENEIIDKIRALFDARQVHLDYFESLRDAVARIEENIEYLVRTEREQDFRLTEHDREIRLLRLRKQL